MRSADLRSLTTERALLAALGLAFALRLALALTTDVYYDEAYYWTWSRHLAAGYFDHPPAIAWLIALLGIRPAALICGFVTTGAIYACARDVHGSHMAGLWAAALWSLLPIAMIAGTISTPDSPLLLFWTLALWAIHRRKWIAAGVLIGLALLSKFSAALLAVIVVVWSALERRLPKGAFASAALAALMLVPLVLWNSAHGWVNVRFQLRHGLGGTGGLSSFAEFVGGQLLLGGPIAVVLACAWAIRGPREQRFWRLAFAAPLVVFGLAAIRSRGEPNWPAMAYVAACIGLSGEVSRAPGAKDPIPGTLSGGVLDSARRNDSAPDGDTRAAQRWVQSIALKGHGLVLRLRSGRAGGLHPLAQASQHARVWALALNAVLCVAGVAYLTHPVVRFRNEAPLERLHGISALFKLRDEPARVAFAPSYELASELAYYAAKNATVFEPDRPSQFDLWPAPRLATGDDALWVSESDDGPSAALVGQFARVESAFQLEGNFAGRRLHQFRVWRLRSHR